MTIKEHRLSELITMYKGLALMYDNGFMELNEFGNGILTNPMMGDEKISDTEFQTLKKTELELSRNYNLMASAFHIQVLAQKVIF